MTPERWNRIDELFGSARRIKPSERQAWLLAACEGDEELRAEVVRLLDQDDRATRDRFLSDRSLSGEASDQTSSWHPRIGHGHAHGSENLNLVGEWSNMDARGFSPRPVIASDSHPPLISEAESIVRVRLRELPMIHIFTLTMATFWRCAILGDVDRKLRYLDASVIALLGVVFALLWSRWRISHSRLQALELGMIGVLAMRLAVVEYCLVLRSSLQNDPMMAQFITKNVILLTAILIPSYGLYVPKNWRRAALVVGPLALLPFATLLVLYLRHPDAMVWLGRGWKASQTPRFLLFSFDAMILLILAVASAFGARAISLLRRQITEARKLGRYQLRRRIGAGGMGEVFLAEHKLLKRPCALKLIRPESMSDPRALARFEREVRLTASLSHPNTVEIYDYGRTDKGTYYYVMEYLPGLSLAELVARHGPQPPGRVVYLLRQVCQALREAHAAGLIHRDIKPSNILVSRRGGMDDVAKLLDFGLVLPMGSIGATQLSGESQVLGTPLFMSPEQATSVWNLDGRSDIYSLGAVAYYLLTGRPPFDGKDGIRVLIAHAKDPVVPPSLVHDNIPQDLERVVMRCLAKAPADRFSDAEHVEKALSECACREDWNPDHAAQWWRAVDVSEDP
jgi:eukaryotic-like serine/threonine-protein kinase